MWYTTFDGKVGTAQFLVRRIKRIVPLYWFVTTFVVLVLLFKPAWTQSSSFSLYQVVTSYLFIPAVHPVMTNRMWPVVIPGWTLNYEMFFYLLFSLTLFFKSQVRVLLLVIGLTGIVALRFFNFSENSIPNFYTSSIILEFAAGVLLGFLFTSGVTIPAIPAGFIVLMGFTSLIIASRFIGEAESSSRSLLFGLPAFLIVAGAVFYERSQRLFENNIAKLLGDASYSIYLSHVIVLSAFGQFWRHATFLHFPGHVILFSVLALLLASTSGIVLFMLVERPINFLLHRRPRRSPSGSRRCAVPADLPSLSHRPESLRHSPPLPS